MDLVLTGATIAKLRKEAGLTQASLADQLGISDKAVSKWERGISLPDASCWNKLSILLDTDIESLIYGHKQADDWIGVLILDSSVNSSTTIYNKPLIDYLLSQFILVGIKEIIIIGECEEVNAPGIKIEKREEVNQQFTKNAFVIYGNQFLYGPNLTKHFKRAMSVNDKVTLVGLMMRKGDHPICVDIQKNGCFMKDNSLNKYYALPYAFISLGDIFEENIEDYSDFHVETLERGMIHFNISSFEEALMLSQFVKMMEEKTGEKIGCIEEIVIRRNLADKNQIEKDRYIKELFD